MARVNTVCISAPPTMSFVTVGMQQINAPNKNQLIGKESNVSSVNSTYSSSSKKDYQHVLGVVPMRKNFQGPLKTEASSKEQSHQKLDFILAYELKSVLSQRTLLFFYFLFSVSSWII